MNIRGFEFEKVDDRKYFEVVVEELRLGIQNAWQLKERHKRSISNPKRTY